MIKKIIFLILFFSFPIQAAVVKPGAWLGGAFSLGTFQAGDFFSVRTTNSLSGTLIGGLVITLATEAEGSPEINNTDASGSSFRNGSSWFFGPSLQFKILGQLTDPSTVQDTNLRGNTLLIGINARYEINRFHFLLGLDFLGRHVLTTKTESDASATLTSPVGLRAVMGYAIHPRVNLDLLFGVTRFRSYAVGSTTTSLSSNPAQSAELGMGLSTFWN